ncbi:uncharacterized protein [Nicotiana tomentosiformis]|uniref:uncharacterized protein n=1 Tax=Nicotiana tomentosiformis TaxID=4098 RepID=UPI00388CC8BD
MREDIAKLAIQVNKMMMQQAQQMQKVQQMSTCCEICRESHTSNHYPLNPESIYYVGQHNRGSMNQNTQYGNTYNPNWRNYPNFSWAQLRTEFNNLERQVGQVASTHNARSNGTLPSDTEKNPIEQVQAINLRSGKALEEVPPKKYVSKEVFERLVPQPEVEAEKKYNKHRQEIEVSPSLPFPQRLKKSKDESKYKKFLDNLSQLRVNLSLIEVLQEVPKYAKHLRDIVTNKIWLIEFEMVTLTEECSVRVHSKLPPTLKDP